MSSIEKNVRRPVANFFIKRSIQVAIVAKILLVVLAAALVTTIVLALIYNAKSRSGSFYYMSNDIRHDIELTSILGIVLPSVISAEVVGILVAVGIGLFSSRKLAVPIYKFEQWVAQLKKGRLTTRIAFREAEQMKDLTIQCNAMTDFYRETFRALRDESAALRRDLSDPASIRGHLDVVDGILRRIEFESDGSR